MQAIHHRLRQGHVLKLRYSKIEQYIFYVLNIALLLFGTAFSKLHILGSFYLHDLLLGLLTILALRKIPLRIKNYGTLFLIGIATIYFFYSILLFDLSMEFQMIAIRQFALFLYLFCCYIIVVYRTDNKDNVSFIIRLSILSFALQLVYFLYGIVLIPGFNPLKGHYYFTPLAVMGIITYSSYVLFYLKKYRFVKYGGALIVSSLLGHSSAFLSVFLVGVFYLLLKVKPYQRFIAIGLGILAILILSFMPQFNDVNANWRILYWQHILDQTLNLQKLGIFGNGFGKPYMTYEYSKYVEQVIGPTDLAKESKYLLRWLTPPHNSFLTFIFHIGVLPVLIFGIATLYKPIVSLFNLSIDQYTRDYLFILVSFMGLSVWVGFNVILELPHSAIYFWLVFFTLIKFNKRHATEQ